MRTEKFNVYGQTMSHTARSRDGFLLRVVFMWQSIYFAKSFYLSHEISICRYHRKSMRKYNWISNRISISDDEAVGTDKDVQISSQLFAPQFQSDVRPPE